MHGEAQTEHVSNHCPSQICKLHASNTPIGNEARDLDQMAETQRLCHACSEFSNMNGNYMQKTNAIHCEHSLSSTNMVSHPKFEARFHRLGSMCREISTINWQGRSCAKIQQTLTRAAVSGLQPSTDQTTFRLGTTKSSFHSIVAGCGLSVTRVHTSPAGPSAQ